MKKYINTIVLIIVSLGAGLILGKYVLQSSTGNVEHVHEPSTSSNDASEQVYTCSMHPQIRQNEPGICPICEMDLIPVDDSGDNQDPTILQMTAEAAKLAQVQTVKLGVATSGSGRTVNLEGTIKIDQSMTNVQTAHVAGRIESINVNFTGQYVKKGQLIGKIYAPGLLSASKELLTAHKNEDRLPGLKDAAIQKIKNWRITDDQINKILTSGQPIQDVNIYADHSGYVTEYFAQTGDYLNEGEVMYRLANTGRLWIEFNAFETDLATIGIGQNVSFTTPSTGNKVYTATVSYIDPILNEKTRTVPVRATVVNTGNRLKPGMLVTGKISTASSKSTSLMVPKSSVLWTGKRSVVYVNVGNEDITEFQYREIVTGEGKGEYYQVLEGLTVGEEVVVNGTFAIDAAAQLKNQYSMMNNNVSIKSNNSGLTPDFTEDTPEALKEQMHDVVENYIILKDAFVNTDKDQASITASIVLGSLSNVDMTLLEGKAHEYWMEINNALKSHLNAIVNAQDVEVQRKQFEFVSDMIVNAIKAFGVSTDNYYVQYCPMAFDNKGADWVSKEPSIRNPYFGDKMMKCGLVVDSLMYLQ